MYYLHSQTHSLYHNHKTYSIFILPKNFSFIFLLYILLYLLHLRNKSKSAGEFICFDTSFGLFHNFQAIYAYDWPQKIVCSPGCGND